MVMHNLPASEEKNAKASILECCVPLADAFGKGGYRWNARQEGAVFGVDFLDGRARSAQGTLRSSCLQRWLDTPMDDRGRKPRRPSATSRAESKVKARMKAAAPAAEKGPCSEGGC